MKSTFFDISRALKQVQCWIYRVRLAMLQVDIDLTSNAQTDIHFRLVDLRVRDSDLTLRLDEIERELRS